MPAAKKNKILTTTPDELAQILKQYGFVTKKEVKLLVMKEVYKITKRNYDSLAKYLKQINNLLKKKFLGKSRYFVGSDPYSVDRNLH